MGRPPTAAADSAAVGYETASVRVVLRPDGVLHGVAKPLARTAAHAEEDVQRRRAFLGERKVPYVLDVRAMLDFDRDVRLRYMRHESLASFTALALVISPGFNRILGNLMAAGFLASRLDFPVRIFEDEAQALAWAAEKANLHV